MRRPHLDGLRFPLFILVFSAHHFGYIAEYVEYALSTFFVLSGFVVTIVLLADPEPNMYEKIKAFYLRRAIRVFPAYYFVVGLLLIFWSIAFPWYYLLDAVNIKLFLLSSSAEHEAYHQWLIANWRPQSLHLWSLGVEEQFYLFYPLVLLLTPPARRLAVLLLVVTVSIATRVWLASVYPFAYIGSLLPVQMEFLAWGGIFAVLTARRSLQWVPASLTVFLSIAAVAACVFVESHFGLHSHLPFRPTALQTPVAFLLGLFIWSLWNLKPNHPVARILGFAPIAYLGSLSFGLYLFHLMSWNIYTLIRGSPAPFGSLELYVATFVITVLLSIAMWHGLEKPANRLRRYVGRGRKRAVQPPQEGPLIGSMGRSPGGD